MKVILYMAITINGLIARENDETDFVSKTEWKNFKEMIKKSGNLIIGAKTYDIMKGNNEFKNLRNIKIVVVSKSLIKNNKEPFIANSPGEAIEILKKQGFKEVLVAGGGKLNASFMKENLIDEIYLDIEPVILGKGIRLFSDGTFETKLDLIEIKKISQSEIQLHYKVKK